MYMGLDLSMRSTGLCFIGEYVAYKLIQPDPKVYNDEMLLIYVAEQIIEFIREHNPSHIGLEGLSFNSLSGSSDLIAGNFWHLRTKLYTLFPTISVDIVPVLSWRSPLFSKEERKRLKDNAATMKALKKDWKLKSKEEKKSINLEHESLFLHSDIKHLTFAKVPEPYRTDFLEYGFKNGCYDLTDAYFIANYIKDKYK